MCLSLDAVHISNQSLRDQFGGTRQDRVRFNPDCTAEPRVSFISGEIAKLIMLLLVSGSRRVMRGDLVGSEGVVINRHFVDGPVEPLTVVPSVGADLNLVCCVEQQ